MATDAKLRATFESYLGAFYETSAVERERIVRANVAEDVAFSNPGADGRGLDTLLGHIARFQERFPGGRFEINWFRQQHGQVLAEWTQYNADGSVFLTANSYARVGEDGRITHFAGFWDSGSSGGGPSISPVRRCRGEDRFRAALGRLLGRFRTSIPVMAVAG